MSAESPNTTRPQSRSNGGAVTVTPQQVTDPTILDSVAGFINEVVPATYSGPCDTKDQIQWAHFEQLECDETTFSPSYDSEEVIPPPLILVLGYAMGIQIWAILANGEATEILSWRHGSVRVLRILPTPYVVGNSSIVDEFASKRPLIALCDTGTPAPHYCALSFLSLRTGEQVKLIKFKNPILDVLANRNSVVVTFSERIAVFDAFTLEDKLSVTTCYLSPGVQPNPVALGARWMAYAEKKLNPSRRSSGGNEGEGLQSYTATVLHAAKSLGRGLRELGETVASSLTGNPQYKPGISPSSPQAGGQSDVPQKGIVTILDIGCKSLDSQEKNIPPEAVIAHFTAHTEAIVCLTFDPSGLLLLTADKRGHDFHLFKIQPHPGGPALAAVHHLYILHRGDTSAKVQDMCFSPDSRWATVSTLRGTTHVFPVTSYGGHVGVRTHGTPYVVNKMSRFHRSAGLTAEGRSNSPVSLLETPVNSIFPYHNPRFPPYPHPTVVHPLAQIRQPVFIQNPTNVQQRQHTGRQRVSSSSEDNIALRVVSTFASPRAWLDTIPSSRDTNINKRQVKPVESLFIMSCHGTLVQYDLDPHHTASIPKERVCDDTPIELTVSAKAQWVLQRKTNSDVSLPMSPQNLSFVIQNVPRFKKSKPDHNDEHWLSQVEIVTHAGPHRRLWMGPQFTFKTYTTTNGSVTETNPIDVGRSKPVNMPITKANAIFIESSSASSCEQSLLDTYHKTMEEVGGAGEIQLREDLADAMLESPGIRDSGGRCVIVSMKQHAPAVAKVVNPLGTVVTLQSDDEHDIEVVEDAIIHENCDEALFRPVVTPKPVLYTNSKPKQHVTDNIITKSLEGTTEVAVKLLNKAPVSNRAEWSSNLNSNNNKSVNKPLVDSSNVNTKPTKPKVKDNSKTITTKSKTTASLFSESKTETKLSKTKTNNQYVNNIVNLSQFDSNAADMSSSLKTKAIHKTILCDISDPLNEISENLTNSTKLLTKQDHYENKEKIHKDRRQKGNEAKEISKEIDTKQLEENLTVSLEDDLDQVSKADIEKLSSLIDNFEDAQECSDPFSFPLEPEKSLDFKMKNDKYQGLHPEEIVDDDKSLSKKPRKPKPKLGVRLSKAKESSPPILEKSLEDSSTEVSITIPAPQPKLSWNVVAAKKPQPKEEIHFFPQSDDNNFDLDLPPIECVEHFTIKLPKKSHTTSKDDLIDIDSPPENDDKSSEENILGSSIEVKQEDDLLKDKSSDDEKAVSSQETTESDDSSSKIATTIMDTEEDSGVGILEKNTSQSVSKSSKRKQKKKRK